MVGSTLLMNCILVLLVIAPALGFQSLRSTRAVLTRTNYKIPVPNSLTPPSRQATGFGSSLVSRRMKPLHDLLGLGPGKAIVFMTENSFANSSSSLTLVVLHSRDRSDTCCSSGPFWPRDA